MIDSQDIHGRLRISQIPFLKKEESLKPCFYDPVPKRVNEFHRFRGLSTIRRRRPRSLQLKNRRARRLRPLV